MVIIPHTLKVFQRTTLGISVSGNPRSDVKAWLARCVGPEQYLFTGETSEEQPWRHRVWSIGEDSSHCFFFYRKKDAVLFKLAWS